MAWNLFTADQPGRDLAESIQFKPSALTLKLATYALFSNANFEKIQEALSPTTNPPNNLHSF